MSNFDVNTNTLFVNQDEIKSKQNNKLSINDSNYLNFIFFPDKDKSNLLQFFSYIEDKNFEVNSKVEFLPYLDFDRVIPIPENIDDQELNNWMINNWKFIPDINSTFISDDGIFFISDIGHAGHLVKRMSEIIKQKISYIYYTPLDSTAGEIISYHDRDYIHLVYKPLFVEAEAPVIKLFEEKLGIAKCEGCSKNKKNKKKKSISK